MRRTLEAARKTEGGALEGRYPVGSALALSQLAVALELVGRLEEAHSVAIDGIEVAARQGVTRTFGAVLEASAVRALYLLGRWDEAVVTVERALEAGAVGSGRISLLAMGALLAVGRGHDTEAEALLAEAETLVDPATSLDAQRWLIAAMAERAIWRGDPAAALTRMAFVVTDPDARVVAAPGTRPAMLDASIPYLLAIGARAWADLALEERAAGSEAGLSALAETQLRAAMRRAEKRRALADAWAGDLALARAELERGHAADVATRVRRWGAAVDLVIERPYQRAYARWRLAEARLARREGRASAAESIAAALATTESLGAAPLRSELMGLAQRARVAVAVDGQTVIAAEAGRPYGLTAREVRGPRPGGGGLE